MSRGFFAFSKLTTLCWQALLRFTPSERLQDQIAEQPKRPEVVKERPDVIPFPKRTNETNRAA